MVQQIDLLLLNALKMLKINSWAFVFNMFFNRYCAKCFLVIFLYCVKVQNSGHGAKSKIVMRELWHMQISILCIIELFFFLVSVRPIKNALQHFDAKMIRKNF